HNATAFSHLCHGQADVAVVGDGLLHPGTNGFVVQRGHLRRMREGVNANRNFAVERATLRDGVEIAYVREGAGGFPLLLLHGWPETKRVWWRNIEPLAAAGFDVIVPDLR